MRTLIALFAVGFALAVSAEQYRLKFSATVDVVEGGQVTGQKRLKAGTILEPAETVGAEAVAASDASDNKKSTKLDKKAVLKDGKEHRALVQVKPTKFKDETDLCVIEEFELVNGD